MDVAMSSSGRHRSQGLSRRGIVLEELPGRRHGHPGQPRIPVALAAQYRRAIVEAPFELSFDLAPVGTACG